MKNYAERKKKGTYDFVKQSIANFRIGEFANLRMVMTAWKSFEFRPENLGRKKFCLRIE